MTSLEIAGWRLLWKRRIYRYPENMAHALENGQTDSVSHQHKHITHIRSGHIRPEVFLQFLLLICYLELSSVHVRTDRRPAAKSFGAQSTRLVFRNFPPPRQAAIHTQPAPPTNPPTQKYRVSSAPTDQISLLDDVASEICAFSNPFILN